MQKHREVVQNVECQCGAKIISSGKLTCPRCHQSVDMTSELDVIVDEQGRWKCQKCLEYGKRPKTLAVGDMIQCRFCETKNSLILKEEEKMSEEMYAFTLHEDEKDLHIEGVVLARSPREAASILGGEFIEVLGWPPGSSTDLDELNLCGKVSFSRELFRRHGPQELAKIPLDYDPGLYYERPGFLLWWGNQRGEEIKLVLRRNSVALPHKISFLT